MRLIAANNVNLRVLDMIPIIGTKPSYFSSY